MEASAMFIRQTTFTSATNVENGVTYLRDEVLPMLRSQRGYRGVTASAACPGGVLAVLSVWDTEADREASDVALSKAWQEAAELVGGDVTVETFEQVVAEVNEAHIVGAPQIMIRISTDPAKIDENISFFRSEILPQIKTAPGLLVLRDMINRETGDGIVSSVWTDEDALRLSTERNLALRPQALARGMTFGEMSFREIVLADLR
jgi:hypothetical protein